MDSVAERTTVEPAAKAPERVEAAGVAQVGRTLASEETRPVDRAVLERLLAMANACRSEGRHRQAMELYWELAEDYPGTPQSDAARAVLLDLASGYEDSGARHMARSIYERLL